MHDVRPPTILLVDDNETQRYAVSRLLAGAGYWVMEAGTGEEALRLAAKLPHLVVLAVQLPDISGIEVCRRLRANAATSAIPVLHLSATKVHTEDRLYGLESGADAYLTHPIDHREMLATIHSLVRMRNAEERARGSALEWQQTFNSITDAICLVDFQGNIVRHNKAMQQLLGAEHASLRGRSIQQLLAERLGADPAAMPEIKGNFTRQTVEVPMGRRWFRVTLDPVLSGDGTLLGAVKILSDITEQKRGDEERTRLLRAERQARIELESALEILQKTKDRAQRVFSSNLIGMVVAREDGRIIEANDYFLHLVGCTRAELDGGEVNDRALTAPAYAGLDRGRMEELAHFGSCTPYEKEYIRRDGSRVPVLFGAAYLEGTCSEYVAFILDLTERKREQAELRRAQERFRVAHEMSLDGYALLQPVRDATGAVADFSWEYLNPAAARILRRPVDELVGHRVLDTFPGSRVAGLLDSYLRVWESGAPHDAEFFYDADGITGWFRTLAIKLDDGVAVSFSDISERKRAEAALRLNEKLAATGRLAASIAHEINNPMASVTNLLYLLDCSPGLDPKAREFVTMARQEVARISHIVKQMLGFYRESPSPVAVDVSEIVDNVLDLFQHKLASAGVTVVKELLSHMTVQAFPGEMRQVFTNLIGNALEAIGSKGNLFIRVAEGRDWQTGREGIRVLVADDGPGIHPDHRARIFEPFFTTKGEKGTGLGLWLSYGIIRKHNGSIRLRSSVRPGHSGTVFAVFLPGAANQRTMKAAS